MLFQGNVPISISAPERTSRIFDLLLPIGMAGSFGVCKLSKNQKQSFSSLTGTPAMKYASIQMKCV